MLYIQSVTTWVHCSLYCYVTSLPYNGKSVRGHKSCTQLEWDRMMWDMAIRSVMSFLSVIALFFCLSLNRGQQADTVKDLDANCWRNSVTVGCCKRLYFHYITQNRLHTKLLILKEITGNTKEIWKATREIRHQVRKYNAAKPRTEDSHSAALNEITLYALIGIKPHCRNGLPKINREPLCHIWISISFILLAESSSVLKKAVAVLFPWQTQG